MDRFIRTRAANSERFPLGVSCIAESISNEVTKDVGACFPGLGANPLTLTTLVTHGVRITLRNWLWLTSLAARHDERHDDDSQSRGHPGILALSVADDNPHGPHYPSNVPRTLWLLLFLGCGAQVEGGADQGVYEVTGNGMLISITKSDLKRGVCVGVIVSTDRPPNPDVTLQDGWGIEGFMYPHPEGCAGWWKDNRVSTSLLRGRVVWSGSYNTMWYLHEADITMVLPNQSFPEVFRIKDRPVVP